MESMTEQEINTNVVVVETDQSLSNQEIQTEESNTKSQTDQIVILNEVCETDIDHDCSLNNVQSTDQGLSVENVKHEETVSTQETIQVCYDTLVLSGCSLNGIVTLGAIQYALDNSLLEINTYIGTSSGALISYLLIIGYTPVEILVFICVNQIMGKMKDFNIVNMVNGNGASSFTYIHELIEKATLQKIGYLPTLEDLFTNFGKKLICVTHNLSTNSTEYLSPETHPRLPCLVALRMSSNLPLIFDHYKYAGSFYIDGGISDNFAIDLGDKMGNKVLGIIFNLDKEKLEPGTNILEYIYNLMFIPICQDIDRKISKLTDKCKIICLYYDLKIFNFNLSTKILLEMFSVGYNQGRVLTDEPLSC